MSNDTANDQANQTKPGNGEGKGCGPILWLLVALVLVPALVYFFKVIQLPSGKPHAWVDSANRIKSFQIAYLLHEEETFESSTSGLLFDFDIVEQPTKGESEPLDKPKLLLSWRVRILPYLGHEELYKEFRLDEPWDSPHNKKLIPKMPSIYRRSFSKLAKDDYRTHYLALRGPEMALRPDGKIICPGAIRDGASRTIMLAEVDDQWAIPWTKPEDLDVTWGAPGILERLRRFEDGSFIVSSPDDSIHTIRKPITAEQFFQLGTIDGGEAISPADFK